MAQYHVLIVDDEVQQRQAMRQVVEQKLALQATCVASAEEALQVITSPEGLDLDLVLLDLMLPGMDGMELLRQIRPLRPDLPFIIVTASDTIDSAVAAIQAGAIDFVNKLDGIERLQTSIHNALKINSLNDELVRLKQKISGDAAFSDIIGNSPPMKAVLQLAERAATSDIPVLIEGESGVGKELFARAIHGASSRANKPFIAVNCGAIPDNLVESTLFGHEKGAFTGAVARAIGKFREADGGTLFLDEIGELRPHLQVKLLRALQESEVEPVGGKRPVKVDIRVISATNRDLQQQVNEGLFREDLYYRLHVFPIALPSLQQRQEDIPLLAKHFLTQFAAEEEKPIKSISAEALHLLESYAWPGNIRQLKNALFRAVVLCDRPQLEIKDFPHIISKMQEFEIGIPAVLGTATAAYHPPAQAVAMLDAGGHLRSLTEIEKETIQYALKHYEGHISEVARRLGIGRSTLYRKIHEMGIDIPRHGEVA